MENKLDNDIDSSNSIHIMATTIDGKEEIEIGVFSYDNDHNRKAAGLVVRKTSGKLFKNIRIVTKPVLMMRDEDKARAWARINSINKSSKKLW